MLALDDHVRLVEEDVVLVVAPLIGDLEDIAEALGQDDGDLRPFAFDQGIGRKGRAMDDRPDILGRQIGRCQRQADAGQDAIHGIARRGRGLGCYDLPVPGKLDGDIGEGAADIHR